MLDVKEEVFRSMGPKRPRGSIAKGSRIVFWSRMLLMTMSLMAVMPIVGLVLLSLPSFFFSYFCRCESTLVVKILVTSSLEVGSKIGQVGGGQLMVISKPMGV